MIRVLCVDDDPSVLRLLETSLAMQPDVAVIPGALDPSTAIERLRSESVDVLVMDYNLQGEPDGLELVRQISQMGSSDLGYKSVPEVVFCTGYGDDVFEREAIRLGAAGVVRKEWAVRDLALAVRAAASGNLWPENAPA
jgi:DNA-binding NarL/FixJ family response regulator